jgi:hypothetical protein
LASEKGQKADDKQKAEKKAKFEKDFSKDVYKKKINDTLKIKKDIKTGKDFMEELQRTENGKLVHDAQEQWALIEAMGLDTEELLKGIDKTTEGWEAEAVQAFYTAVESDKEAIESLNESIEEQE